MDTFRWISIVLSMILGLGVARLLTGFIAVFRARHRASIHALPLSWAVAIFVQQLAFWWNLEELSKLVPLWSLAGFLLLVGLVLTLFVAASLVLPPSEIAEGDSLLGYFNDDGRWALAAIAAFNGLAILADLVFWQAPLMSWQGASNLALCVIPLLAIAESGRVRAAVTAVYVVVFAWALFLSTPLTQ